MKPELDHAEYARRAIEWLNERNAEKAKLDGFVMLADVEPQNENALPADDEDAAVWAHCGRILRERDPETYEQIRTMALALAVLAHEARLPNEN